MSYASSMQFTLLTSKGLFENGRLTLDEPYLEEKEKEAELRFPRESTKLLVNGRPFTHVKIGVPIEVIQGTERKQLLITVVEGSGDFSLHLYFGKPMEGDQTILVLKALRRDDRVVLSFQWD